MNDAITIIVVVILIVVVVLDLLEEPVSDKDSEATEKAKNLFASCTNESKF